MTRSKKPFALFALMILMMPMAGSVAIADTVDNPGAVTMNVLADSGITVGFNPPVPFGPMSMLGGVVTSDGDLALPVDQAVLQPITIFVSGVPITLQAVLTQDGLGNINPITGSASLVLSLRLDISGFLIPAGCQIPETTVLLDVMNAGGVPYDLATGTATFVDTSLAIPRTTGCGFFGGIIDSQFGLPSPSGQNVFKLSVSFDPILAGS